MVQKLQGGGFCNSHEAQAPLSALSVPERQLAFQPANWVTCSKVLGFVICFPLLGAVEN